MRMDVIKRTKRPLENIIGKPVATASLPIAEVLDGGSHGGVVVVSSHQAAPQFPLEEDQPELAVGYLFVDGHRLRSNRIMMGGQR